MKKIAGFLIPPAILMALAMPGFAQSQYRFEVFGAASLPMDKDFEITTPQSSTSLHGTHQFSLGGRGGVRLGTDGKRGHWGQDFIYSFGTNASKIINQTTGAQFAFTTRTHQVAYNALWYPGGCRDGKNGIYPYATAGVGGTFHTLSQNTINEALDPSRAGLGKLRSENVFAVNAGGGIRVRINRVYGIRIDARDYMSRAVRYGLPKESNDPTATVFPVTGIFHQIEVSFAFVYYF
jgi:hypothetical protein